MNTYKAGQASIYHSLTIHNLTQAFNIMQKIKTHR